MKTTLKDIVLLVLIIACLYLQLRSCSVGITTRHLAIIDEDMKVRATLSSQNGNTMLSIADASIVPRIGFGVVSNKSQLAMYDKQGRGRVYIGISTDEAPSIQIADVNSKPRITLAQDDNWVSVYISDTNGDPVICITDDNTKKNILLYNSTNKPAVAIYVRTNDLPCISLWDGSNRRVGVLPEKPINSDSDN